MWMVLHSNLSTVEVKKVMQLAFEYFYQVSFQHHFVTIIFLVKNTKTSKRANKTCLSWQTESHS